ncbi:hypothetical protein IMG5_199400 [Ichthyophthirius multifiliis]|uniref:Uncharacterized protein n=1 Tax=Ichthyophthirius multifiliis TaxID=5932 RepID=G0R5K0_ICHMU|nr:hypothetical protein IMG5_199400 [Ichthyophthirius multifiliis]EGR27260.1 hypothetical protein IMG5_199400 [Ichthyophthirius multifiliis]|eukprot:XP_004024144.1 hypothetical protein IMG5_199400 [Ichthyophthirius multifiliis]
MYFLQEQFFIFYQLESSLLQAQTINKYYERINNAKQIMKFQNQSPFLQKLKIYQKKCQNRILKKDQVHQKHQNIHFYIAKMQNKICKWKFQELKIQVHMMWNSSLILEIDKKKNYKNHQPQFQLENCLQMDQIIQLIPFVVQTLYRIQIIKGKQCSMFRVNLENQVNFKVELEKVVQIQKLVQINKIPKEQINNKIWCKVKEVYLNIVFLNKYYKIT